MQLSRRLFLHGSALAAAGCALPAWAVEARGVRLGLQTFTFHNVRQGGPDAIDEMIRDMQALKVDLCELWAPQAEPFMLPASYWAPWQVGGSASTPAAAMSQAQRDERRSQVRAWRLNPPPGYFESLRARFRDARITLFAYNYSFEPTMTDGEIEHGFIAAKALGVETITASSKPSVALRVAPFAQRYGMTVAFHNHANLKDADDVTTPDSFRKVLAMSPHFRMNLDVAHFASAGFDPIPFLEEQHANIVNLHVHDRLGNDGKSVPMGAGIVPVQQVLKLVRDRGWKFPCFYELEYVGADGRDVVAETRRELEYEVRALQA